MLDRWEDLNKASGPTYYQAGQYQGAKALLVELENAGASKATLREFHTRIDEISRGTADPTLGTDLLRGLRQAGEKQAASTPARTPRPRPSTPTSRRSDNERMLDPDTPIEELKQIRARQEAAGE